MGNVTSLLLMVLCTVSMHAQSRPLFNGVDLEGWSVFGTEKWYVENGELVCESGKDKGYGYLSTDQHYKNYVLNLDFKQEANGNSGVFIRSTVEGTTVSGWQIEVAPPGYFTGGIYESYGRKWLVKPELEKDNALKFGEWNHMKIKVDGNTVTSWVNGMEMVSLEDEIIGAGVGSILLQIHDGGGIKVRWKNIEIQELD
ncbi:DUF1080 domain-containing protein [Maribacter confluentis]|uniref:DUF1080 domain-containing protein n=1 Tax=Maribacter confluentis TaxID=1656093 RepID=A0ABT8RQJ8_9FLAO|nr:DUF1080 domain-containing protein [Maribacter confluentis]MDO1512639.1 DUF1080 domain-containing protein [Maribacter confluentis]